MFSPLRRVLLPAFLLSISSIPALAVTWKQPTPDDLKMTADPAAPDAPAVYLFREEIVDDKLHYHHLYAQIKVLNDKGKEQFSDIEIPYEAGVISVRALEGRTIHPDGTIVPFTGNRGSEYSVILSELSEFVAPASERNHPRGRESNGPAFRLPRVNRDRPTQGRPRAQEVFNQ